MDAKKLDWNKPIETIEGCPAKVISEDYMYKGKPYRIVQMELPGGNSVTHMYREDGESLYGLGMLRNKTRKVTRWLNLYENFAGMCYYLSADDAERVGRNTHIYGKYLKTISVEVEVPCD
jgi:hypothetical protein